jgi:hypothetical protein
LLVLELALVPVPALVLVPVWHNCRKSKHLLK